LTTNGEKGFQILKKLALAILKVVQYIYLPDKPKLPNNYQLTFADFMVVLQDFHRQ